MVLGILIAGGLMALYFAKTAINFNLTTNNTVWQSLDPRRYLPGLMDSEVRDKRSRVSQPQYNIRLPYGASNAFQHNIEYMPPFVTPEYSVAYARNYTNVSEIGTPDWRIDPAFAGVRNNYSGYYLTEPVLEKLSNHVRTRDRWRPAKSTHH